MNPAESAALAMVARRDAALREQEAELAELRFLLRALLLESPHGRRYQEALARARALVVEGVRR